MIARKGAQRRAQVARARAPRDTRGLLAEELS